MYVIKFQKHPVFPQNTAQSGEYENYTYEWGSNKNERKSQMQNIIENKHVFF